MRASGAGIGQTNCPRCNGKVPEDVIANFLKITAEGVHQYTPGAKVLAWPYSAQYFWSRERSQLQLIDRLGEGVGFLSEIDKDEVLQKDGYQKKCWDYSVDFDGHSDRIIAQATRCGLDGRELFIKTETSHGIELLHPAYVPAIQRSARKWQSVRALRPAGVLQRWGFIGMFDSAAERIGFLARWDANFEPESAAQQVARQLTGSVGTEIARAWKFFDHAIGHLPTMVTGGYYHGPLFLGPGCPLPVWSGATPDAFLGNLFYLAEGEATGSRAREKVKDDFTIHSLAQLGNDPAPAIQEAEYERGRDLAAQAYEILRKIDTSKMDAATRAEVEEQLAIGEYLYRTFRTAANLVRFLRLREGGAKKNDLVAIAKDEMENAVGAQAMWQRAEWLNHSLRIDVGAPESLKMVGEKISLLRKYVEAT